MKLSDRFIKLLCATLFSMAHSIYCQANEDDSSAVNPSPVQILLEYKKALPEDAFAKLIDIYSNESIALIDREREAVNYFSNTLPRDVKTRMPVPFGFRKLPQELQARVKSIYYQTGMSFEEKLMRIGMIITETIPKKEFNALKSNLNASRLGLIEFRVNVTLSLNGLYTVDQLKQVLSAQQLDEVSQIQEGTSPHEEKATAVGQILRKAYSRSPKAVQDQWPAIFGSSQFPEYLKKATTYMLFNENPSRDMAPFAKVFRQAFLQDRSNGAKRGLKKRDIGHYRYTRADRQALTEMFLLQKKA